MTFTNHPVNRKSARKGEYRVSRIREEHRASRFIVDNRPVQANGVDLVCYKRQNPNHTSSTWINGKYCPKGLVKIYEITNWNKKCYLPMSRALQFVNNLNREEEKQKNLHPKSYIMKFLVVSYKSNIKFIPLNLWAENNIIIKVIGVDEEPPQDEEEIEGWID